MNCYVRCWLFFDLNSRIVFTGTTKVDVPYKIGDKSVDIMLEVSNLEKKETVSIDTISNQELSEVTN